MKFACLLVISGLIAALISPQVLAALTAEELAERCESTSSIGYCEGYITGFHEGRTITDHGKPELMSCPPTAPTGEGEVSYSQMVLVFRKWAKEHPDKLHYPDWAAVREAFAGAWPCKPKPSQK